MSPSLSDLANQLELLRAQERARITQATLRRHFSGGVAFSDLGHLVAIDCPVCGRRIAFQIDFSAGAPGLAMLQCEYCKAEIEGYLTRGLPPVEAVEIISAREVSQA